MKGRPIRTLSISGDPGSLGRTHGAAYAEDIRAYCSGRISLSGEGNDWNREQLVDLGTQMLPAHRAYDEALYEEMLALADSAGISGGEAVIVGGYTDFIDTVRAYAGSAPVEDNCTAVIAGDDISEGHGFLAQTWDMNASATPHVVLLEVAPDSGPRSLVFTTVGTLGQIGMNEAGIAIGINNLTADDGQLGVTWPFVVRKALAQTTFEDAMTTILDAELAGGHNFLVFDNRGNGASVEAMPTSTSVEYLGADPVVHTNHCLAPQTQHVEGARPADLSLSSTLRLTQAEQLLTERPITVHALVALTRDERSICRRPEPPNDYESCGAAIMRPATGDFWACWGIPSENLYEHFTLDRAVSP